MVVLDLSLGEFLVEMHFLTQFCLLIEIIFLFLYKQIYIYYDNGKRRKAKERKLESRISN